MKTPNTPTHWALYRIYERFTAEDPPASPNAWRAIQADSQAMHKALRVVLDMHEQEGDTCRKCSDSLYEVRYPCWTVRAIAGALGGVTKPEDERPADWLRSQVARSAATLDGLDPELRKTMAHRTALRNTHGGDS